MREVILTAGPQGAGKSTFCEKVIALDPSIELVSRDKILIDLFGKVYLDPYTGGHHIGMQRMWEIVEEKLSRSPARVILDTWNSEKYDRVEISSRLRELGASKVIVWYFTTPADTCFEWWFERDKPEMGRLRTREYYQELNARSCSNYHKCPPRKDDGFDHIIPVNPLVDTPEAVLSKVRPTPVCF